MLKLSSHKSAILNLLEKTSDWKGPFSQELSRNNAEDTLSPFCLIRTQAALLTHPFEFHHVVVRTSHFYGYITWRNTSRVGQDLPIWVGMTSTDMKCTSSLYNLWICVSCVAPSTLQTSRWWSHCINLWPFSCIKWWIDWMIRIVEHISCLKWQKPCWGHIYLWSTMRFYFMVGSDFCTVLQPITGGHLTYLNFTIGKLYGRLSFQWER